jgi:hypothetical protein
MHLTIDKQHLLACGSCLMAWDVKKACAALQTQKCYSFSLDLNSVLFCCDCFGCMDVMECDPAPHLRAGCEQQFFSQFIMYV